MKIIFVCTGNTCRSAMAEAIFKFRLGKVKKAKEFRIFSAGLNAEEGSPMSPNAVEALKKMGIRRIRHSAKRFTMDMVRKFDLIITMTAGHMKVIGNFPNVTTIANLTGGQDIADPYGMDINTYLNTAKELDNAFAQVMAAAERMASNISSK